MKNVKNIPRKLIFYEFLITFSYDTIKGYYREQERTIYCKSRSECVELFKEWSKKQRTMTNVGILAIEKLNKEPKIIEL